MSEHPKITKVPQSKKIKGVSVVAYVGTRPPIPWVPDAPPVPPNMPPPADLLMSQIPAEFIEYANSDKPPLPNSPPSKRPLPQEAPPARPPFEGLNPYVEVTDDMLISDKDLRAAATGIAPQELPHPFPPPPIDLFPGNSKYHHWKWPPPLDIRMTVVGQVTMPEFQVRPQQASMVFVD